MASSDRDKSKQGKGAKSATGSTIGPEDSVGPKGPRWAEPKTKAPIAIALDYKKGGKFDPKAGPRVSATGKGAVAEQILQIAFARGIPVREDPDLAQILSTLEVDDVIPTDALAAVAEILSYLYRLNGKVLDGRTGAEDADGGIEPEGGAVR